MQPATETQRMTLPASVTAETAEALLQDMLALGINSETSLTIDATQVEHLSTCGVQLLVALDCSVRAAGGVWRMDGNACTMQVIQETGLGGVLLAMPPIAGD